jgi:hypothetical protein
VRDLVTTRPLTEQRTVLPFGFGGGLIEIHPAAVWRSTGGF